MYTPQGHMALPHASSGFMYDIFSQAFTRLHALHTAGLLALVCLQKPRQIPEECFACCHSLKCMCMALSLVPSKHSIGVCMLSIFGPCHEMH